MENILEERGVICIICKGRFEGIGKHQQGENICPTCQGNLGARINRAGEVYKRVAKSNCGLRAKNTLRKERLKKMRIKRSD